MTKPAGIVVTGLFDPAIVYGINLACFAAEASYDFLLEMADDAAFTTNPYEFRFPGTQTLYSVHLPNDDTLRYFRLAHVKDGVDPSDWTATVADVPRALGRRGGEGAFGPSYEARRRGDTMYDSDGQLLPTTQINDASTPKRILRGLQVGRAQDGDAVTFAPAFNNVPTVIFLGGMSRQPVVVEWSGAYSDTLYPVYDASRADGLSAAGFTAVLKLRQKGTPTARNTYFSGSAPNLTAEGDTNMVSSAGLAMTNAPASNDSYEVHFEIDMSATSAVYAPQTVQATVAVDTRPSGGSWTERGTKTYSVTAPKGGSTVTENYTDENIFFTVSGLVGTSEVRLRLKTLTFSGGFGATGSATVKSFTSGSFPNYGLRFATATDLYTSKTPDVDDFVTWLAFESET